MNIHLFLILCVFKTSFSKSSRKHDAKLEGNVMIEKILKADRFDELADKIVNKALEKLKHETSKLTDSSKTTIALEPITDKNVLRQNNKKAHKGKEPKIDINAVLQKKVIPFNELLFRYDHFTKNPDISSKKIHSKINNNNNKKRHKTNSENVDKKTTKEKPQVDTKEQSDKDISKSQEIADSKKNKQTDLSSENMTFNTKLQNESGEMKFGSEKLIIWGNSDRKSDETVDFDKSTEDHPTKNKKGLKIKQTTDLYVRARSIEQETNENNDNQQKDDENQTDEPQKKGHSKQAEIPATSTKLPEVETTFIELGTVPDHSGKEKDSEDENDLIVRVSDKELTENKEEETSVKQPLDQSEMNDDETDALTITEGRPKKQKRLVRKEGDKWFAFEESPDYAEYLEKFSAMRKSLIKD